MKIAFLVDGLMYPDFVGGAEIFTFRLAKELSEKEHDVHLIAKRGPQFGRSKEQKLVCHAVSKNRVLGFLQNFVTLTKINPDVVVTIMLHSTIQAYLYSKLWRKPLIVRLSGSDINIFYQLGNKKLKDIFYQKLNLTLADSHANFVALSEEMQLKLLNMTVNHKKITIIPNFVDECFFNIKRSESHRIVYVGTLRYVKGVDVLIRAFKMLNADFPDYHLILVGDGKDRPKIDELIKALNIGFYVQITGQVPYWSVGDQLSKASVFVLPSRSEGLSNALLQAMAAGLPIVATNVGGSPSLIQDSQIGLLVPPDNPEALYHAIKKLLLQREFAEMLGKNAKEKTEQYRVRMIVARYEELFKKSMVQ
jgi:glycosyltransferase involved in cell wall biosynthesis